MKIGVITNLVNIDQFVRQKMLVADTADWMLATGGNTGNVAFVEGILKILGGNLGIVNWGDNSDAVNKHYDRLVVCCANQLGTHVDLGGWADCLNGFNLPTTFIGLGAQSDLAGDMPVIPEGTLRFLDVASSCRFNSEQSNIITRGSFTSDVLKANGYDSAPLGCPSQFISPQKNLGLKCLQRQQRGKYQRVMVAAGNPWHPSYTIEKLLIDIVNQYNGDYVLQHPRALFDLATGALHQLSDAQRSRIESIYGFLGDLQEISKWFSSYAVFFADAQNWMHYSKRFSLVLGPRYHGVALPIQVGVPGKVIAIDSRTEELSAATGVPFVRYQKVENLCPEDMLGLCRWSKNDAEHYDAVRLGNASQYAPALEANGLEVSKHLKDLAGY